jgi:outer membrane protein insertion porin family
MIFLPSTPTAGCSPDTIRKVSGSQFTKLMSRLFLLFFLCLGSTAALLHGQDVPPAMTVPVVGEIRVEFTDIRNVSDEAVLARVQIRAGMPYSQTLVDRSIRSLYATRLFDYIEARTEEMPANQIRIVFVVQARYRIDSIVLSGNQQVNERRLRREIQSKVGGPLDERQLRKDADKMVEHYREKGYTDVRIDFDVRRDRQRGVGEVTFLINEGYRLRIKRVEFVGNTVFSNRKLRKEMETRRRWFMSWLTGSGRFDEAKFQEDLDKLKTLYMNAGHLDVSIPESNVTLDYPKPSEIVITVRVDEGRRYQVGNVTFEGNTIFTSMQLYPALNLLQGDVFSPEVLDEDVERLTNIYGSIGYLDTVVRPERRANIATGAIDIVYSIRESERFDVESIVIEGNTKTKSVVIIRELALTPGRTFNLVYMKNSEARLRNTRFFEEVQLSPESTNIPGKRNLKIRVKEGPTGNFQFGAGFSSLENVVVFFEVSQSNFDLFKWRSPMLQGAGQKFRFRGSIGSYSNELVIYFEEPWLFQQRLSFGVELFRRETDYNSTTYNELRTGIETFLRKRLIGLIDGQATYSFEIVDLKGVTQNAPLLIKQEAENSPRSVSKVDFTILRDTRNDFIFTTRGTRISFSTTFAGLGGDTEYVKFETRNAFFLPTFTSGDQVLSLLVRAGTLWEYSDETVPFFDRFYLGGPHSLRGFEYREVGPFQSFEPIGGNTYGFASLEYSVKVADPLRLAIFYDWGFVNAGEFAFSPASYNDNWGFGIRLLILGNPLRLDYGIPMTSTRYYDESGKEIYDNNRGNQFNFSFGTRF